MHAVQVEPQAWAATGRSLMPYHHLSWAQGIEHGACSWRRSCTAALWEPCPTRSFYAADQTCDDGTLFEDSSEIESTRTASMAPNLPKPKSR